MWGGGEGEQWGQTPGKVGVRAARRIPETEDAALRAAIASSKELKRLESNYTAKGLEIKGDKAQRLPKVDLVAQYALLTRFSNYDQYFAKFQRNNGQLGASIQVPLLTGATHCFVAATVTRSARHPLGRLIGDTLVLVPSASGRSATLPRGSRGCWSSSPRPRTRPTGPGWSTATSSPRTS